VAVLTLALAIGANAALFSIAHFFVSVDSCEMQDDVSVEFTEKWNSITNYDRQNQATKLVR
jgi:hypothetical protein